MIATKLNICEYIFEKYLDRKITLKHINKFKGDKTINETFTGNSSI